MVGFYALQALALFPLVAVVALLGSAVVARQRRNRATACGLGFLAAAIAVLWLLSNRIGFYAVGALLPDAPSEITARESALIDLAGYGPYLLVGLIAGLVPRPLGLAALSILPTTLFSCAEDDAAVAVWVAGLRWFGIYMAAFAVLMFMWNSGSMAWLG